MDFPFVFEIVEYIVLVVFFPNRIQSLTIVFEIGNIMAMPREYTSPRFIKKKTRKGLKKNQPFDGCLCYIYFYQETHIAQKNIRYYTLRKNDNHW